MKVLVMMMAVVLMTSGCASRFISFSHKPELDRQDIYISALRGLLTEDHEKDIKIAEKQAMIEIINIDRAGIQKENDSLQALVTRYKDGNDVLREELREMSDEKYREKKKEKIKRYEAMVKEIQSKEKELMD